MDIINKFPITINRGKNIDGILSRDLTLIVKCCCCLLVGLHHFARIKVEQQGSSNPIFILLASQGGNVGVGLFFFLSGYGLMESAKRHTPTFIEIIRRRFFRLVYPIFVVSICYILFVKYVYPGHILSELSLENIYNIKKLDPVLWFIEVLFSCYVIFYIALSFRNWVWRNLTMYGGGCILIIFYILTRNELHWHYTNIPMFFLGVAYAQFRELIASKYNFKNTIGLILGISLLTTVGWFIFHTMWARLGVSLLCLYFLLVIVQNFHISINKNKKITDITYEYYLTHNKILMIMEGGYNILIFICVSVTIAYISRRILHYLTPKI